MEELKEIVNMIKELPQVALWVLIGFWAYKVIVVGSIYGVIRFCISKVIEHLNIRKTAPVDIEFRTILDGMCISIDGTNNAVANQLKRIAGKRTGISTRYIPACSSEWLREAIDEKEAKEINENK